MNRKALSHLKKWFKNSHRKPLILRGARQVGKSTLVSLFSKEKGLDLLEVNLEVHRELDDVFKTLNPELIIRNLQSIAGKKITKKTLLFLDEIQATPNALAALRYFFEKMPELPIIGAGSLLEFSLADHSFSMPVGRVEYYHLHTMTFYEFLETVDPYSLKIAQSITPLTSLDDQSHKRLLLRYKEYMLVGGMPEAVAMFSESPNFEDVAAIQDNIINTYLDDFSKYAKQKELSDLQMIFKKLPTLIGAKLKYTSLLPGSQSAHAKKLFELLEKAKICSKVVKSACNGIPLAAEANHKFNKALFLDVGLASRILGLDWRDIENLADVELVNKGALAEQFVGQHLQWGTRTLTQLHYWAREAKNSNAELDYVLSIGSFVVPLEVKSGLSGTLKSLHQFMLEKKLNHAFRLDLNPPSKQQIETSIKNIKEQKRISYTLHSLPLYAIENIPTIINKLRAEKKQ